MKSRLYLTLLDDEYREFFIGVGEYELSCK
jgi:hypothetical protein